MAATALVVAVLTAAAVAVPLLMILAMASMVAHPPILAEALLAVAVAGLAGLVLPQAEARLALVVLTIQGPLGQAGPPGHQAQAQPLVALAPMALAVAAVV